MNAVNPVKKGVRFSFICIVVLIAVKIVMILLSDSKRFVNANVFLGFYMFWFLFYFLGNAMIYIRLYSKYRKYLYENHRSIFNKITSISGVGPGGGHNSFREIPFLFSDNDLGDPRLLQLKRITRKSLLFLLCIFLSLPVITVAFMFL